MSKIFSVLKLALIATLLSGCVRPLTPKEVQQNERARVNRWVEEIIYMQDPRTGICFSVIPGGTADGVATVPCASIPDSLLFVAEVAQ